MAIENVEVDVTGLEASLNELVKAADATDLVKGKGADWGSVNREHSGRMDEDGKGGGGVATEVGSLDDMMIGKMSETAMSALADAGFTAPQIAAFMSAKQEDEEEGEEEEEEGEEEEMEGKAGSFFSHSRPEPSGKMRGKAAGAMPPPPYGGKKARKSASSPEGEQLTKSIDHLREDPDIGNAIDVSAYLEAMTMRVAEQIDGLTKSTNDARADQQNVNRAFAAALWQTGKLVKSQAVVIQALGQRLGLVEAQPAPAKGVQSPSRAAALAKGFAGEAGGPGAQRLSKSEILGTLSFMRLEKGITEIHGQKTSEVIGLFEGGNVIAPETVNAVESFLRQNPGDATKARAYR